MHKGQSFKSILDEKLSGQGFYGNQPSIEIDNSPAHMAFLLGLLGDRAIKSSISPRAYRNQAYSPKKQAPRPAHQMTALQVEAYIFIVRWAGSLSENFTNQDLKQAFRRAALKLHPDQGGSAALFLKLKAQVQALESLAP